MWVARLKIRHENSPVGIRCSRFKIEAVCLHLTSFHHEGRAFHPYVVSFRGLPERITMCIEDIKTDSSLKYAETEGDTSFFLDETSIHEMVPRPTSFPHVFSLKPVSVDAQGIESWEACSWDEPALKQCVISLQKDFLNVEVLGIEIHPLGKVYSQQITPELTEGQQQALRLAVQRGYYNYPRKTELAFLAQEGKISLSTFREHLRKAEKKVMEDIFGKAKSVDERLKGPV
ncbi:helix-turn-helix domain-containing protein [Candidatus Woesearchaeota archaeon]|nr:helix-turn-helix domain-containing protein [Candidatus Woesearchaeota archaeon]